MLFRLQHSAGVGVTTASVRAITTRQEPFMFTSRTGSKSTVAPMRPTPGIDMAQSSAQTSFLAPAPGGAGTHGRSRELLAFKRLRESGDPVLREQLVERRLGLAGRLAQRYANPRRRSEEDVLQVARIGLVKAVDRFDPDRGVPFSAFAVPTILGEIKRYFRDTAWASHVPRGLQETSLAIERASRKLAMRDGRSPTVAALAAEIDVSEEEVVDALQANQDVMSLDTPVMREDGDGDRSLLDTVGTSEPGYELALDRSALWQAARGLSDRDRQVLKLRFEEDFTQQQIAERIGVSQMQVSRLLRHSLQRLREAYKPPGTPGEPDPLC
jgi:RNA polymerase sigma-B factor